jgi:outer membrane protein assembly factor BamD (BamD/ComL family)
LAEKKVTRKELLKEPDEFLTVSSKALKYARENPRIVVIACALFALALVAAVAVYGLRQYRELQSHQRFDKAYGMYRAVVLSPEPVPAEGWDQLFKEFDQIAADYPSLVAGERALLYSAHVLYQKKDYQGALDRYTRMKSTTLVEKGLGSLVMYHMAMTQLALKDYETAKQLFSQLTKDTASPYCREAYISLAGLYEATDQKKEAAQAYRQYLKMFPQAPDAAYVRARIADLSTPG